MNYNIAVLAGDGIGPEIIEQAKKVVTAIGKKYNHSFNYTHALVGAVAIDKTGNPLPAILPLKFVPNRDFLQCAKSLDYTPM